MARQRRRGRYRLSMDVPESIYERLKDWAETRNITITKWVLRAIIRALREEEKFK